MMMSVLGFEQRQGPPPAPLPAPASEDRRGRSFWWEVGPGITGAGGGGRYEETKHRIRRSADCSAAPNFAVANSVFFLTTMVPLAGWVAGPVLPQASED